MKTPAVTYTKDGVRLQNLRSVDFQANIFKTERKGDQYFKTPSQRKAEEAKPPLPTYSNEY
jgi:hypothetical protein